MRLQLHVVEGERKLMIRAYATTDTVRGMILPAAIAVGRWRWAASQVPVSSS